MHEFVCACVSVCVCVGGELMSYREGWVSGEKWIEIGSFFVAILKIHSYATLYPPIGGY